MQNSSRKTRCAGRSSSKPSSAPIVNSPAGKLASPRWSAALYPGATPDHVQVTNGGSEANYIVTWRLVEPGDEVVLMVPNYMQTRGLSRAFGGSVREWRLRRDDGAKRWAAD